MLSQEKLFEFDPQLVADGKLKIGQSWLERDGNPPMPFIINMNICPELNHKALVVAPWLTVRMTKSNGYDVLYFEHKPYGKY